VHFNSGESEVHDKPRPGRPCSAAIPHNEQSLDQLIRTDQRIRSRKLRAQLNIGCTALETMLGKLDYHKVGPANAYTGPQNLQDGSLSGPVAPVRG
jgi:hypothetical protein